MTLDGDNGWLFVADSFGDYRGINETLGLRTRLKWSLEWAKKDVEIGRLQTLIAGEWTDKIDRFDKARDYV